MRRRPSSVGTAVEELAGLALGDARLEARTRRLVAALAVDPAASFPAVVPTEAEREATYRLLGNRRVTLPALLAPHVAQTQERMRAAGRPPTVVVDKTAFVFHGEAARDGLTRLGVDRHGFDAMVALAVGAARVPLGVLGITPLTGAGGRASAETWCAAVDAAATAHPDTPAVYVMDQEADSYRIFAALTAAGREFVIRVAPDRWVQEHQTDLLTLLPAVTAALPVWVRREVALARRTGARKAPQAQQRHPPRAGRDATLALRAGAVVVPRPPKLPRTLPAQLTLHVVHIVEEAPPADVVPVEWWLFTSRPMADTAAVEDIVDRYRARWTIEEYFKALKSGCAYERRQLERRATLLAALGLLAPLAWRLLALRTWAADPTAPAAAVLDTDELHVVQHLSRDVPLTPDSRAADVLRALASLGGHFRHNGPPGWQVLWRGWQKLGHRVDGYRLPRAHTPPRHPADDAQM